MNTTFFRGDYPQAIGRSKGGLTTKILALTDAAGALVRFKLLPGQRSELIGLDAVIEGLNFGALLADRAFDTNALRAELQSRNAKAMIPSKKLRKPLISHDGDLYKRRHLIENYFSKIKEFRGVNTRYDKTDSSYAAS